MAKILAVDDEPSIVRLVQATLKARGHEVVTAGDGQEALLKARMEKPDLIVLDIMMPLLDGHETRKRLKADAATKDIPIIFASAVGELSQQLDTMEEGDEDYITKPFKPSELAELVADTLDPAKREELRKNRRQRKAKLRTMVEIMHRDRGA
ncbi:MAG: response regulator [Coriobacteriia bacterium]|nr:response regulator [Coriobacteriia bacterium]